MNILITGGAGYLGMEISKLLLNKNHNVTVLDKLDYNNTNLSSFIKHKNFNLHKIDIRKKNDLKPFKKNTDLLIHLAGIVGYPACNANPNLAKSTNITGSKNISEIFKDTKKVNFNTCTVYGEVTSKTCKEDTKVNPKTLYARTKFKGEQFFNNSNSICLRLSTVFGISETMRHDLLIHDFINTTIKNKYLEIYQKGFIRNFISVEDISRLCLFIADNKNFKNGIYNVGDKRLNLTKEDLNNILINKIKYKYKYKEFDKDQEYRDYILDVSKLYSTGFKCKSSFNDNIDYLIKFYSI